MIANVPACLQSENMLMMVAQARLFMENYDDDAQKMFYYNFATEEALWEVPKTGYVPGDSGACNSTT